MKTAGAKRKPHADFPFIALADIAWQIIIFFLLGATFARTTSLNIDLPGSSEDSAQKMDESITVQASSTAVTLNGKSVDLSTLPAKIKELIGTKKNEPVVFLSAADLTFQRSCEVMLAIQQSGGLLVLQGEK